MATNEENSVGYASVTLIGTSLTITYLNGEETTVELNVDENGNLYYGELPSANGENADNNSDDSENDEENQQDDNPMCYFKRGWDYLDVIRERVEDPELKQTTMQPVQIDIKQVYPYFDLNLLGIPQPR